MSLHLGRLKHMFETPETTPNNKGISLQSEISKDCERHIAFFPTVNLREWGKSEIFKSWDYPNMMRGSEKSDLSQGLQLYRGAWPRG